MMKRLKYFLFGMYIRVSNLYEAARLYDPARSFISGFVRDARFDAGQATRRELQKKSRNFEANNGIFNKLVDLFEQYVSGPDGLQFIPASSDEEWNDKAIEYMETTSRMVDVSSRMTMGQMMGLSARAWFVDGEFFLLKTRGESGRARLQLIESHRVATPLTPVTKPGFTIDDGIEYDSNGRPVAYYVDESFEGGSFRRIDAQFVIHGFEPSRIGQKRGIPMCYPVMNAIHDLDDLDNYEMSAAKEQSERSTIIYTPTGEASADGMRRQMLSFNSEKKDGTTETKTMEQNLKLMFGGRVKYLKNTEKVEMQQPKRPSAEVAAYWDYKIGIICAGVGISKLLVLPYSVQGTVTRADLDAQNSFFRARSHAFAQWWLEAYYYLLDDGIYRDVSIADKPMDWRNVIVQPPRSVNVDVGRNSAAMLAELEAGARTYADVYAELGKNWRKQFKQIANEIIFDYRLQDEIQKQTGRTGVSIRNLANKSLSKQMPEPEPDDVEEKPKSKEEQNA